jgi:hypothetical protein
MKILLSKKPRAARSVNRPWDDFGRHSGRISMVGKFFVTIFFQHKPGIGHPVEFTLMFLPGPTIQ